MVYDDIGIFYDTTSPSRLEKLILEQYISKEFLAVAQKALDLICQYQLSKYNHTYNMPSKQLSDNRPIVLVIDQTYGDMAVKYGQANELDFLKMVECAISENPHSQIWIKTHPDVISGKKRGYLTDLEKYGKKITLISEDINPLSLLNIVDKVYCVTSQMGFEALFLGKKVVTFGVPWFSGWGVTDDRHESITKLYEENRRQPRTLLDLFYASYIEYSRYINPNTGEIGTVFDVIEYLNKMKSVNQLLSGNLYCIGLSMWKKVVMRPFFNVPSCKLHFVKSLEKLKRMNLLPDAKVLIWSQGSEKLSEFAKERNLPILRMEDGFIRSVGLGSNLVSPISLVVDDLGIYFNPLEPSRLEIILQLENFSEAELKRAEYLRTKLVSAHIGKYNVGHSSYKITTDKKRIILVPGQVEDDASIKLGSPKIRNNLELLKTVRAKNPDAYIVYKPHPDVVSGNRIGHINAMDAQKYADEIVEKVNILDCIEQVTEVHTITSLAGFEALLRGKIVHCYGLPFYSNWGLTKDEINLPRRSRKLTILELIAGVLLKYPLYVDPGSNRFINAEYAIEILERQRNQIKNDGIHRSWISKQCSKLNRLYAILIKQRLKI